VPAPIVVEVYAPQPQPQELSVLLSACSRAASPNECVSSDVKTAEPPLGVAIVRRDGEHARIELGLRNAKTSEWSTRDLTFQPADDELERYRAIGFAIGTLVARQTEPPAPAAPAEDSGTERVAPPPEPEQPLPVEPEQPERHAPTKPAPARATWVDVAGGAGLGLIPGPPRVGGALRAASELTPGGFFGVVETAYAERVGEPELRVRWLSMAAGVGHSLAPNLHTLRVELRLMLGVERLAATAYLDPYSATDSRWKPGVVAALDAHWNALPPVGVVLSAATFIDPRRTEVRVAKEGAGETPPLGLNGFLGVRLKLR
jgi:hypothetical protein